VKLLLASAAALSLSGYGTDSHRIRRVDAKTGVITTVAGLAKKGFTADGGPALSASLDSPGNLLFDRMGNLYLTDNGRVRYIDAATKTLVTAAGAGEGFSGDGGPAIRARLEPSAIALDSEVTSTLRNLRTTGSAG
jgi:hypothetical protein